MAYTRTWDEAAPTDSDAASTIDDLFRNLKIDIRERMNDILSNDWATDGDDPKTLDARAFAGTPQVAVVYTNAAFPIPDGVLTVIDFVGETLDTSNPTTEFHSNSVNPSRLTIETAAYYRITASIQVTSGTSTTVASIHIRKNGTTIALTRTAFESGVVSTKQMFVTYIDLAADDDYYEIALIQNSGDAWVTLDIATKAYFMIEKLAGTV